MRNIKLVIEYDGSRYDGWQKPVKKLKGNSIQEKIEYVLRKMESEETIELIGAARTEAGVHASGQIANFITDSKMKVYEIKQYLNRFLPMDIAILEAMEVPERFHSNFHAKSFRYQYKIAVGEVPSVFQRKYQYYSFKKLDIVSMKKASEYLIGKHDFKAFSDNKRMKKSTEREIFSIHVQNNIDEVVITIKSDDFWPHMARIIVGTLLEVGNGSRTADEVKLALESKDREKAGITIEAKGLFLQEVEY